jgi:hypothetical protein
MSVSIYKHQFLNIAFPKIAEEWHPSRNTPNTPNQFTTQSNKIVWWSCSICKHEWKAKIYSRLKSGCPQCYRHSVCGKNNNGWKGYMDLSGAYWYGVRRKAQLRKFSFLITIQDAWNIFTQQNKQCALTGRELTLPFTIHKKRCGNASLDRIDSSQGYTKGNIQWIHKDIQRMKWALSEEKFFALCEKVSSYKALIHQNVETTTFKNRSHSWRGYKNLSRRYWSSLKNGAKKRELKFEVTIKEGWELFEKQNECCALTGLSIQQRQSTHGGRSWGTASLDRIDSTKGYIPGNIQWVHKDIQLMKYNYSQNYFIQICQEITNHLNHPNTDPAATTAAPP